MSGVILPIFILVYLVMAVGQLPFSRVDRTGAALLAVIALVVTKSMTLKQAWDAIDYRSLGMLFGLMLVSATFVESGFYIHAIGKTANLDVGPRKLLAILIAVSGILSSILTNDVVVVAMTPLLVQICQARNLNPVPFLLGFGFAANSGSVGTIIGSPQNMIIGQSLGLSFTGFMKVALAPSMLCLVATWGVLVFLYRGQWTMDDPGDFKTPEPPPVQFDRGETIKGLIVTALVVLLFVATDWPKELIALGAAGVLLINRKISSVNMLRHVDGDLLLMLMGLFVVNAALASTHLPNRLLADLKSTGVDLADPGQLYLITAALSDIVGNNPAIMMLVPYVHGANPEALGSGLSGNVVIFGSLVGIIIVDAAGQRGVKISFREFSASGLPVTVVSLAIGYVWIKLVV